MSLKIIICLGILSFLIFGNDANRNKRYRLEIGKENGKWKLRKGNYNYACPKSPKFISPDISLSPFKVSSDPQSNRASEIPLVVAPISRRTFKKLDMTVLPSREVCVVGKKLKNFVLPRKSQFRIMVGIAIWFSPCLSLPTNTQRFHCMDQKVTAFESIDIKIFKTFFEFLSLIVQQS